MVSINEVFDVLACKRPCDDRFHYLPSLYMIKINPIVMGSRNQEVSTQHKNLGQQYDWQSTCPDTSRHLPENEVHIWALPLTLNAQQSRHALELLNDQQRDRYLRRPTQAQGEAYLAGRYYLLTLLAAYSEQRPEDILLSYSRLNKPYLEPNPLDISFNFTDTQSVNECVGLYAFCRTKNIGVDIEALARRSNFAAIVARKFSAAEQDLVTNDSGEIDPHHFLATWTRKEAYGKATGLGVNFKMNELEIANLGQHSHAYMGVGKHRYEHWLEQFYVGDKHIACVTYEGSERLKPCAFRLPS